MGKIIWLASFPKSGNTWVRAFLRNLLLNPDKPVYINDLGTFCMGESTRKNFDPFLEGPWRAWTDPAVAEARPKVHAALTGLSPDSVFVKTHCALAMDHGHPTVNLEQTAGAIYIVRNPLDITVSLTHHTGMTVDQAIVAMANPEGRTKTKEKFVTEPRGSWSNHVASWTGRPHPGLLVVRYEDMLEGPDAAFGRVVRFLGLDPPPVRFKNAINMSSFDVLQAQEQRWGFVERGSTSKMFFRAGRAGQWKEALTPAQIAQVIAAHRAEMARFGYLPSGT
ncbi:MAG: sulfotransferase domain-containing protein [Alphaproteobacteria bacterium]